MRQNEDEYKMLRDALDGLRSSDVAPAWHKEPVWNELELQLAPRRKRRLPVWLYPAAAAAALCLLLLRIAPADHQDNVTAKHTAAAGTAPGEVLPAPKIDSVIPAVTGIQAQPAVHTITHAARQRIVEQPAPQTRATAVVMPAIAEAPLPEPAPVQPEQPKIIRRPEVVYTLNEIMDRLPEREEQPKTYTIIFRIKPAAETPMPRRETKADRNIPEDAPPHIIN